MATENVFENVYKFRNCIYSVENGYILIKKYELKE